ncbi:hypothetical protein [Halostagnicola sp. A-GB9-2]|uniref:hypothetical protein n=1 Tax=Halostagnicola sp. A-GB9-2 TaxID=3048066 RepID=UPI0024C0E676|nr:hypothetical protein [Halostagnicola sp. A-GB9-2]MDJ1431999.1 hypothetical protein [Halostagnicola sp. A-GB9-2]
MSRRSILTMLTASGVGLGAVHASGAFDVAQASRQFNLGISSDDEALLKIEPNENISGEAGEEVELATVTNEFSGTLSSFEITTGDGDQLTLDSSNQPTTLASGERAPIVGELSCASTVADLVSLQIVAEGPDNSVELERDIDVHCEPADETCVDEYTAPTTLHGDTSCDVVVETMNAHLTINPNTTVSGDVYIEGSQSGSLDMSNSAIDGDVTLVVPATNGIIDLRNSTIDGDVTIDAGSDGTLNMNNSTINGDVAIDAGVNGNLSLRNSTIDGDASIDAGSSTNVSKTPPSTITGDSPES